MNKSSVRLPAARVFNVSEVLAAPRRRYCVTAAGGPVILIAASPEGVA